MPTHHVHTPDSKPQIISCADMSWLLPFDNMLCARRWVAKPAHWWRHFAISRRNGSAKQSHYPQEAVYRREVVSNNHQACMFSALWFLLECLRTIHPLAPKTSNSLEASRPWLRLTSSWTMRGCRDLMDSACVRSKEVRRVALVHLVLGACYIQVNDPRVFDFPAPACIFFVVLCCGPLTADLGRRYHELLRKLCSCLPWVVLCVSSVGLVQCSLRACPPHRKLWLVSTDDQRLRLGQASVRFVGIGCLGRFGSAPSLLFFRQGYCERCSLLLEVLALAVAMLSQ